MLIGGGDEWGGRASKVGNCLLKLLCASGEEFGGGGYRGGLSCDGVHLGRQGRVLGK